LLPFAAHGSFNSGLCGKGEFGCHFAFIGLLLGFFGGLPISAAIFVVIHLVFRNPERDKVRQVFLVAWVLMAIGSALYARSDPPS
jgi:hypothetical protein